MTALVAVLMAILIFFVIFVISAPLRAAGRVSPPEDPGRDDLEAARAAKYREIRDAELDFRTGKLSRQDYEAVDGSLRSEAVEILDRLELAGGAEAEGNEGPGGLESKAQPDAETRAPNAKGEVDGRATPPGKEGAGMPPGQEEAGTPPRAEGAVPDGQGASG
jgi:hypothetical protein